jgi:hypothetical protein
MVNMICPDRRFCPAARMMPAVAYNAVFYLEKFNTGLP